MIQYSQQGTGRVIRQMELPDLEQVCRIEKENFTDLWTVTGFRDALLQSSACFLVLEEDGRIRGYCGAYAAGDEADIVKVSVDYEFQNQKIATKLLLSLFQRLQTHGVTAYTLEVRKSNLPAVRLYEKLGFVTAGVRPSVYGQPREDAVVMWKR